MEEAFANEGRTIKSNLIEAGVKVIEHEKRSLTDGRLVEAADECPCLRWNEDEYHFELVEVYSKEFD